MLRRASIFEIRQTILRREKKQFLLRGDSDSKYKCPTNSIQMTRSQPYLSHFHEDTSSVTKKHTQVSWLEKQTKNKTRPEEMLEKIQPCHLCHRNLCRWQLSRAKTVLKPDVSCILPSTEASKVRSQREVLV